MNGGKYVSSKSILPPRARLIRICYTIGYSDSLKFQSIDGVHLNEFNELILQDFLLMTSKPQSMDYKTHGE